ncbi:hypothetical protein [Paenisporosarcina quisquiliarum]|uniref:hypothetical protein n=1 Tax=Paenisporosarcina quisquiliarum TaxID=365346 RepID=UPI0037360850
MMKDNRLQQAKELQEKVKSLQQKKKRLENEALRKVSWENRKARTKRLIETGALAEKYFGLEELSVEDREKVFQMFSGFVKSKRVEKN